MDAPAPRLIDRVPLGAALADRGAILERFLRWVQDTGLTPYAHQEQALLELAAGKHVVLSTPTGSGKSLVALGLHFQALCEGKRSFYTAPIKALVSEKFFALCETLGAENVGMLTGDASINWAAPVICCTQEVLANIALRQGERTDAPYVAVDEFHFYADRDRGWAWQVPLLALPRTTFLLMSATLGNTAPIEERLRDLSGREVAHVWSDERPVPLDYEYRETPLQETVEALLDEKRDPIYVVNFTQREAVEVASALTSARVATREQRAEIARRIETFRFDTPFGKEMKRIVSHGIGLHHAGMLPKYRLLVEQLSQAGLLRVISGTDTLGVGVNIPIRSVLFTKLSKFDGERVRLLSVRDFKQIAGRAGRRGFDTRGSVVCQAPEHVIAGRARKRRNDGRGRGRPGRSGPPPGFVSWTRETFEQLVKRPPETLQSVFRVTHGMMISLLQREPELVGRRGGYGALAELIALCHESDRRKRRLVREAAVLFRALRRAEIVHLEAHRVRVDPELQRDFALHQALSLYLVEAIAALPREAPDYALQVVSVVEAVQENPGALLRQQLEVLRRELLAKLKAEHVPFEERMVRLDELRLPAPEAEFVNATFRLFAEHHPWVDEEGVRPKSIAREMLESGASFDGYVRRYALQRSEGLLLRYLSQVHATLDRTVPDAAKTEALEDAIADLREIVRHTDSSLLHEWESRVAPRGAAPAPTPAPPPDLAATPRALLARVRAEMRALLLALAEEDYELAAACVRQAGDDPWNGERFRSELGPFLAEHGAIRSDPAALRGHQTTLRPIAPRVFRVSQSIPDPAGEDTWSLEGEVDLRGSLDPDGPLVQPLAIRG